MSVLIVAGAIGGILAGVGGIVAAVYYGAKLLELRAEKGSVKVYFDSMGIGRALYANATKMITVEARLANPRSVPAIVEDVTLWYEHGGLGLGTLVDTGYGYTTSSLAIEVPPKQAVDKAVHTSCHAFRRNDRAIGTEDHGLLGSLGMILPITRADLDRLVTEAIEEGVRLDFKRQLPEPGKNDDLKRDLAALANTEGGVLIYGVTEDENCKASGLLPFVTKGAAERVALIAGSIDEPVAISDAFVIPDSPGSEEGYLVVEVSKSDRAPHVVNGTVFGRTPKGNTTLTRRQIGELFARQPGYAAEFGLSLKEPGRLKCSVRKETHVRQTSINQPLRQDVKHYLRFENDGSEEITDANWRWVASGPADGLPDDFGNPFPIASMPPGAEIEVQIYGTFEVSDRLSIETTWRDPHGELHTALWPFAW